jgi:hypothetical protein
MSVRGAAVVIVISGVRVPALVDPTSASILRVSFVDVINAGGAVEAAGQGSEAGSHRSQAPATESESEGSEWNRVPAASADTRSASAPTVRSVPPPASSELPEDTLVRLSARLTTTACGLSGRGRVIRAYEAGRRAGRVLRGDLSRPGTTPNASLRETKLYVVLRSDGRSVPVYTLSAARYFDRVRPEGGPWDPLSVSHGFASLCEAEAYVRGAGFTTWPLGTF